MRWAIIITKSFTGSEGKLFGFSSGNGRVFPTKQEAADFIQSDRSILFKQDNGARYAPKLLTRAMCRILRKDLKARFKED